MGKTFVPDRKFYIRASFLLIISAAFFLATVIIAADSSFSNHTPGNGSTITSSSPKISVYVKHTQNLNANSLQMNINGVQVAASFLPKGYWYEDYDTGETLYMVEDEREGTISYQAPGLPDENTVAVSIADITGLVIQDTWGFYVAEPPKIKNVSPANAAEVALLDRITAVITDNGQVDLSKTQLLVDGASVNYSFDSTTGTLTYLHNFSSKLYQAQINAVDLVGNASSYSWSFTVDSDPPALSSMLYFTDGMKITDGILKFYVQINDLVDIADNVSLKLNGNPLPIQFQYKGETGYDGQYYITSRKEAYVSYEGNVATGSHTLSLYTEDKLGNIREYVWSFSSSKAPVIVEVSPVTYNLKDLQPLISAKVDADTLSSTVLTVNGSQVAHSFDSTTGVISYTPFEPFNDESRVTVALAVYDIHGQKAGRSWSFYTNARSLVDMADNNIASCTPCHSLYTFTGSNGPFEDVHGRVLSFSGDHSSPWDCDRCHNYINVEAGCQQCHGDLLNSTPQYNYAPHGSTPSISYELTQFDADYPVRIKQNREMFDCSICHQPGVSITRKSGAPLGVHNIPELHKGQGSVCSACHALSLTREHAQTGRAAADGSPVNCGTCHNSTSPAVTTAITGKQKACNACHENAVQGTIHAEKHQTGLTGKCADCHGMNMMNETQYHKGDCSICHTTNNPTVESAVVLDKESCFDCHAQPHGVYMYQFRSDIPLYSGVSWGAPQSGPIWAGESWLPAELNDGASSVVFSSRAELDKAIVYDFYSQAMATNGWTLLRSTYPSGFPYFELIYQKNSRYAAIWFYRGEVPNTDGTSGVRLQVAYH